MITRRTVSVGLVATATLPALTASAREGALSDAFDAAARLPQLNAMIVARGGDVLASRVFDGPGLGAPVNVKSASKTVLAALVGAAVDRDVLRLDQTLGALIPDRIPAAAPDQARRATIEDLLTMRLGLASTSGRNYGPWAVSDDWVAHALTRPVLAQPGARMTYSTGTSHLLSVALSAAAGRSTLALMRDWLGEPLGFDVPPWTRDPQGVFMGGNEMALSPRALLALGETFRQGGTYDGARVLPEAWVRESWRARGRSRWTGAGYGYGWWLGRAGRHRVAYAWGYGGQMLYVLPSLDLTVVMTSDPDARGVTGHVQALHRTLRERIVPSVTGTS